MNAARCAESLTGGRPSAKTRRVMQAMLALAERQVVVGMDEFIAAIDDANAARYAVQKLIASGELVKCGPSKREAQYHLPRKADLVAAMYAEYADRVGRPRAVDAPPVVPPVAPREPAPSPPAHDAPAPAVSPPPAPPVAQPERAPDPYLAGILAPIRKCEHCNKLIGHREECPRFTFADLELAYVPPDDDDDGDPGDPAATPPSGDPW